MTEPTDSLVEIVARAMRDGLDAAGDGKHFVFLEDGRLTLNGYFKPSELAQAVLTALSEAGPTEAMMQAVDAHCSGPIAQWAWRAMLAAAGEHSHGE